MTEYWKSLPKKFCDACKCWFADNKASIEFHERGVRHKQNVEIRIREAQKKGKSRQDTTTATDDEMRRIEAAALKSFEKDVLANPSLSGQYSSAAAKLMSTQPSTALSSSDAPSKPPPAPSASSAAAKAEAQAKGEAMRRMKGQEKALEAVTSFQKKQVQEKAAKKWKEMKSEDGYSFFIHQDTMDSRWDPPPEGYVSLAEQMEADGETTDAVPAMRTKPLLPLLGATSSIGSWTTVEANISEPAYVFPTSSKVSPSDEMHNKAAEQDKVKMELKTKTVTSLEDVEGCGSFKKRKVMGDGKRQVRRREAED
ncbi:WW domain-binding protein 4-like [Paramacrobiotus metropolitanus]|uniref:WW domain-binding protein 4-like n=1 Tax=Paramacrobiotus metropolitanus TaxID=2943436 RepID=UPI0024464281|nr:WW domain-binding protein 4-like [Paramacrobiotus metropolitanus]